MPASTQWRIRNLGSGADGVVAFQVGFGEIEMASSPGGADLCTGGTANASTTYYSPPSITNYAPSAAFDGTTTGNNHIWYGPGRANHWISYTFASPVDIVEIRLWPTGASAVDTMWLMAFEYLDVSGWKIAWIGFYKNWVSGTGVTFNKPSAGMGVARYWGLDIVSTQSGSTAEIVDLQMRESAGGADATGSGTAASSCYYDAGGGTTYPPANAFDANVGDTVGTLTYYSTGATGEALLWYDFGSGVAKAIQEIAVRRQSASGSSPAQYRMLKSTDGRNWAVHSEGTISGGSYSADGNYYNTETALVATLGDYERVVTQTFSVGDAATALVVAIGAGMARIFGDRVMENFTTTGTGNITVAGAVDGFQAFSGVCDVGDTFDYCAFAVDDAGMPIGAWETGHGTYTGTNTIERTTVQESSNSNNAVSFLAGTKRILLSHNATSIAQGGGASEFKPGVPALSDFTQVGSSTTTNVETPGAAIVLTVTSNGYNIMHKAVPATPYRIAVALTRMRSTSGDIPGVGFYDPVSTKSVRIRHDTANTNFYIQKFTGGTYNSDLSGGPYSFVDRAQTVWFGLRDDGTNVYYEFSPDGVSFVTLAQETKSSGHLAGAYTNAFWGSDGSSGMALILRCWDEDGLNREYPAP